MKILVCGGRNHDDGKLVCRVLDLLNPHSIVFGDAPGADEQASYWARSRGCVFKQYHARWNSMGKAAGPARNAFMLKESKPDLVIAFPGGDGTRNMTRLATEAGVPVLRVDPQPT